MKHRSSMGGRPETAKKSKNILPLWAVFWPLCAGDPSPLYRVPWVSTRVRLTLAIAAGGVIG